MGNLFCFIVTPSRWFSECDVCALQDRIISAGVLQNANSSIHEKHVVLTVVGYCLVCMIMVIAVSSWGPKAILVSS